MGSVMQEIAGGPRCSLRTCLVRGAEPNVLDLFRRDTRARDRFANRNRGKIVRAHAGERAAVAADRRANGGEDDGAAHAG